MKPDQQLYHSPCLILKTNQDVQNGGSPYRVNLIPTMYNRGRTGGPRKPGQRGIRVFSGLPDCTFMVALSLVVLKCLFVPDIHFEALDTREKEQPLPMTGLGSVLNEVESKIESLTGS